MLHGLFEKNYSVLSLLCDYDNLIVVKSLYQAFCYSGSKAWIYAQ